MKLRQRKFKTKIQLLLVGAILCCTLLNNVAAQGPFLSDPHLNYNVLPAAAESLETQQIYSNLDPDNRPKFHLFKLAYSGYKKIIRQHNVQRPDILTIIDYSLASVENRLFVIDLTDRAVDHVSLVAHGMKSGDNYAVHFSNDSGSHQSSLGFYITGKTYLGKHGYSLKLHGLEAGFNDNARDRAIVIHGANYATKTFINTHGRLGRSWGCPALPPETAKKIIDAIKNGSCLFIFGNDNDYLSKSALIGYENRIKQK